LDREEESEFAAFVHARSAVLYRTAVLLTGSRDAADDLVQGTLERVCRHWRRARVADSPEAYARRVLVNLANDRWRGLRRRREVVLELDPTETADPFGTLHERDALVRELHRLPQGMRTVLVLRYFEDLADESIADLLGITPATVRSQAARGLAKLREEVRRASVR
jgi:RNA polymerase sigma-70 factor (sigma-E family)